MILLRLNGEDFNNFVNVSVSNGLQALSGKFSFSATNDNTGKFPFTAGDKVQILIKELDFLVGISNGFIDSIKISYSKDSHSLLVSGRDKTEDILDSQIKDIELTGPFSLEKLIRAVLDFLGIKDIKVINFAGKIDDFKTGEIAAAEQAETGFSFINKYAEARQVLLSNDGDGNIILTRVINPLRNGEILNIRNNPELNNVKSAHVVFDHSQRFNEYSVMSQFNPTAECGTDVFGNPKPCKKEDVKTAVNKQGLATVDGGIRTTRRYVLVASKTMDVATCTNRAKWEAALRIARTQKYHVTVQGFLSNDGLIWQTGQLVKVRDEFASIDGDLIVSEIAYNFSVTDGSTTTLTLVKQDVYKPLLELDAEKVKVNKMGTADSKYDVSGTFTTKPVKST